jgi:hypothetical protein
MRTTSVSLCLLAASTVVPLAVHAQMPGLPVLQNAFTNPGITVAANVGFASDLNTYGGAVSWVPGGGRFGLSAGAGSMMPDGGDPTLAYGARGAVGVPWLSGLGDLAVAVFVGAGGASRSGISTLYVPAGLSVGWRRALGATRGISLYAAPFYGWTRVSGEGESDSAGLVRASFGLDVTIMPRLGATLGVETGATADDDDPGPTGTVIGAGVSYAFR